VKLLLFLRDCLQAMSAYGYEIVQTLIVDIEPDEHVKRAMNEINAGILHHQFDLVLICFQFPDAWIVAFSISHLSVYVEMQNLNIT
jgi:hypothetical protein